MARKFYFKQPHIGPFSFDAYLGYQERLVANNTYQGSRFYIGFSTFYQGW